MFFTLFLERIRAVIPSLSAALIGGAIISFFSYSASYGQFWAFDSHLMPIFSTADLIFNFSLLAIPVGQTVVVAWYYYEMFFDVAAGDESAQGYISGQPKWLLLKWLISSAFAAWYVLTSDDKYQLGYKCCLLLSVLVVGVMYRQIRKRGLIALRPARMRDAIQTIMPALAFLSFTVALYGAHETTSRMKSFNDSKLMLRIAGERERKIVILFSSASKAIAFDGTRIFIVDQGDYKFLSLNVDVGSLRAGTILDHLLGR